MMGDIQQDEGHVGPDPIGVLPDGQYVWPVFGAEDDDEDDIPGGDDDEDDEDEDEKPKSKRNKSKSKDKSAKDEDEDEDEDDDESEDEDVSYWRTKANTFKRRMEAADRRATEAERENRRLKQTDKDRLDEPGKQDLKDAQEAAEKAAKATNGLRLQVALLSDTTYAWHDPALVIKSLLDDDTVEIDEETGKVLGVKKALQRLAKSKPYLVKSDPKSKDEGDDEDDEDEDEEEAPRERTSTRAPRSSGAQVGSRKRRQSADRAKIVQKYPILNRR